jgi:hypothetical protein
MPDPGIDPEHMLESPVRIRVLEARIAGAVASAARTCAVSGRSAPSKNGSVRQDAAEGGPVETHDLLVAATSASAPSV